MPGSGEREYSYACPRTGVPLAPAGACLRSADGSIAYPVRDGIPVFLRYPAVEDAMDEARLEELLTLARIHGWREALVEVRAGQPAFIDYILSPARVRFLDLVPLQRDDRVLEIGPGLGQVTRVIARRVRHLDTLEVVKGQAAFVRESCVQEGLGNVRVACGGDDCRLPYAAGSFDTVVLNLVFEWCGSRESADSHEAAQERLLGEIHRVLARNGTLFLATKNRFGLRYLLGKPDEHACGIRFGSALPRRLLRRVLRSHGQQRPQGYLYSYGALDAKLGRAGFSGRRSFWAAPDYRFPERILPADAASIRAARKAGGLEQGEMRSTRLVMPLVPAGLVKQVMPGLLFLARRD